MENYNYTLRTLGDSVQLINYSKHSYKESHAIECFFIK